MSAAQLRVGERFFSAMGPMIDDEEKVTLVINLIDYMRRNEEQLPQITEEELQNSMPLDMAMNKLRQHIHAHFQERT